MDILGGIKSFAHKFSLEREDFPQGEVGRALFAIFRFLIRTWAIWLLLPLVLLPTQFFEGVPTVCTYRILTGKECPGCGMTRACCEFFHGHIQKAMAFNRAVVIVAPLLLFLSCYQLFRLLLPRNRAALSSHDKEQDDLKSPKPPPSS